MRTERTSFTHLIGFYIIALCLLAGCGGNGSGKQAATGNNPFNLGRSAYVGRVLYRFQITMTSEQAAALPQADRAALAQQGATISGNTITFPDIPAAGHWVRIGTMQVNTDSQGRFGFSTLPANVSEGSVYIQLSDSTPRTTFPVSQYVVPADSTAPDLIIVQSTPLPGDMNPTTGGRAAAQTSSGASCCANTRTAGSRQADGRALGQCVKRDTSYCGGNDGPCCLDFDNPSGDGIGYFRGVTCPEAYFNWLHSTCYEWSGTFTITANGKYGTACANEGAYVSGGPGCYANHKWRNCQHLDNNDFSIKAERQRVYAGETMKLTVRNNTQANETDVQMSANPGKLTGDGLDGTMLKHYKDGTRTITIGTSSVTVGDHYIERVLTYTAPAAADFPAGKDDFDVTVTVRGFDKTDSVTFKVCKCPPGQ
ncbi:MAG TPA: hypothetical protein VFB21_13925 [Chthonomonadaceae bacterium]|nr:hypothetical protein [Chthonomonadaceae bacterium]